MEPTIVSLSILDESLEKKLGQYRAKRVRALRDCHTGVIHPKSYQEPRLSQLCGFEEGLDDQACQGDDGITCIPLTPPNFGPFEAVSWRRLPSLRSLKSASMAKASMAKASSPNGPLQVTGPIDPELPELSRGATSEEARTKAVSSGAGHSTAVHTNKLSKCLVGAPSLGLRLRKRTALEKAALLSPMLDANGPVIPRAHPKTFAIRGSSKFPTSPGEKGSCSTADVLSSVVPLQKATGAVGAQPELSFSTKAPSSPKEPRPASHFRRRHVGGTPILVTPTA